MGAFVEFAADVPEGPSRQRTSSLDALSVGFEKVDPVGRVFVDRTAQDGQQDQQD